MRWYQILCTCFDVTRGSLWWVKEQCWKATLSVYDTNSQRLGHPGLSIREIPPATPYEMIPMLHGTSGNQGPVVARGLSPDKAPDYATSFGHLKPADLGVDEFRKKNIQPNRHKPKLTNDEMDGLMIWLKRRGLA